MEINLTTEEFEKLLKNRTGYILLNDPIFDDLYKAVGAEPRKKSEWGWKYAYQSKEMEGYCIDHASIIDQKYGRHDYRCASCGVKVDYFIGGEGNWWPWNKPSYCPNCGIKLGKVVQDLFRKEVKPNADSEQDSSV